MWYFNGYNTMEWMLNLDSFLKGEVPKKGSTSDTNDPQTSPSRPRSGR